MPRCKHCKDKFEPLRFNQKYCMNEECVRVWVETEKQKQWKAKKTRLKKELMSLQDWLKLAQMTFNKYIRHRDKGLNCISCDKPIKGVTHASHYFSSGGHSNVRFHEDNVHSGCYKCNVELSGHLIEYRKRLIQKIGAERLEWLENNANNVKKWTIEDLQVLINQYKQKIKQLEK